jgi:hypothetical protein
VQYTETETETDVSEEDVASIFRVQTISQARNQSKTDSKLNQKIELPDFKFISLNKIS